MYVFHFIISRIVSTLILLFLSFSHCAAQQVEEVVVDDMFSTIEEDSISFFDQVSDASYARIQTRTVADSTLTQLKQDDAFWYANGLVKPNEPTKKNNIQPNFLDKPWVKNVLWALIIIAFIAVLVSFLWSSNIRFFRTRPSAIAASEENTLPEDIFAIDYNNEIDKAKRARDYPLAIRLLYLQLLTRLSQSGIIQYKDDRTNSEYLLQVYNTGYYKPFFGLTRSFEYCWYGKFAVTPEAFSRIENDFATFNSRLPV